ncbi:MAG TPA: AraC family transcriptional regulator [Candidatus Saccharimonadia bacterium]|nr:AraC family transcriptional regulator [Candidatus Saccharimonadia bacterium]
MADVLQESAESKNPRGHLDPQGFDKHVEFHTYEAPADLQPFLEHFWVLTWHDLDYDYQSEQVMHQPVVDVFVSADWSGIQGTFRSKRTYVAKGQGRIVGARFLPGAFYGLWPGKMTELQDHIADLQTVFPEADNAWLNDLLACDNQGVIAGLASLLRAHVPEPKPQAALIQRIITFIEHTDEPLTVAGIAAQYDKSERWLQQLFQDYVGVGLKWLLQRHKLLIAAAAIRASEQPDWSAIAYDAGYSSQQHFITDFKRVTGKTPREYKLTLA